MKLCSYKETLRMGKKAVSKMMIPAKVARAKKQAELEMCKIDEEIATKQESLQSQCSSENVDFSKIISLQDDVGLLERKKKQYQKILDEMFPDEA
jgi:hypothetical protein